MSTAALPTDSVSEVAFAGRSNVGKSSTINKITHRRALARTSKSPGRTRELNYFAYDKRFYIVDLPGYGYAKVSAAKKKLWAELLEYYLYHRAPLKGLFLIMDIRHPLTEFDQLLLEYTQHLPVYILLNKADKLSRSAAATTLNKIKDSTNNDVQLFSALKATGINTARAQLAHWLFADHYDISVAVNPTDNNIKS